MQLDYYRSPIPRTQSAPIPPDGMGCSPRRKRKWLSLILFLSFIVLLAAVLIILQFKFAKNWDISLEGFWNQFESPEFSFEFGDPDEFDDEFEFHWSMSETEPVLTMERADLAPNVEMRLTGLPGQTLSFQEIYQKVIPSIVSIQARGEQGLSQGTGIVLTGDGYVVTNHHIISGCSSASVVLHDGTPYDAKLVGSDAESDLAVLKIEAQDLMAAEFGNSNQLQVGDTALAIGNPLGAELFGTLTEGIISAINRDVNVEGYSMSLIQTTAALNPGNSGGALLNESGQVVGITNMKMMSSYETIEGLGFAIPTVWAKEVVDTLLDQGKITGRPTIGIMCFALSEEDAEYYSSDVGIFVDSVTDGGPADLAGLQPGDVILTVNGQSVTTLEELTVMRDQAGVGGEMKLTVWREGETFETTLIPVEQYELD